MRAIILATFVLLTGCAGVQHGYNSYMAERWSEKLVTQVYTSDGRRMLEWSNAVDKNCAQFWMDHLAGVEHESLQHAWNDLIYRVSENCYSGPGIHSHGAAPPRDEITITVYDGIYNTNRY